MARIEGTARGETIDGSADGDSINGLGGNDVIRGLGGNDTLFGGAGDDILMGGAGRNFLIGGFGIDIASYVDATAAVVIDLGAGSGSGLGFFDTLAGIEGVTGSAFGDTILGSARSDIIDGGDGDDLIVGGLGADTIEGGLGYDTLSYAGASIGIVIPLGGDPYNSDGDIVSGIEAIIGSAFNDVIGGFAGDGAAYGGAGSDLLLSSGGNNLLDGGSDIDFASYFFATSGVTISLAVAGPQANGSGGLDTLIAIENLAGSAFRDRLTGNDGSNLLIGEGGNDILDGGGGQFDFASYDTESTTQGINANLATGRVTIGDERDTLINIEGIIGSWFDDRIVGDGGANTLIGGLGADTLTGGAGADRFFYQVLLASNAIDGIDRITDLSAEDSIVLSPIDANVNVAGDQAFTITDAFHGIAGELVLSFDRASKTTAIMGDVNGDAVADLMIYASGRIVAADTAHWIL